jgi:hypothetical protein
MANSMAFAGCRSAVVFAHHALAALYSNGYRAFAVTI